MRIDPDHRARRRAGLIRPALAALLVLALNPVGPVAGAPAAAATADSFVFGTGGDHSSGTKATAVLRRVGAENLDFFLSLGDLSYDTLTPAQWCTFVHDNLNLGAGRGVGDPYGRAFPFQLTEGNHEQHNYDEYLPCLPDRMDSSVLPGSSYGRDYYFDYPRATPLARFIVAAPGIEYTMVGGGPQHSWLSAVIDQARAAGIRWVIVANHKNYVTAGEKADEIGSAFFNLLVQKRVDLVLQGHEHNYQRSHQLGLSSGCPAVPKNTVQQSCIVASGSAGGYAAGRGTVLVVSGLAGQTARTVNLSDPEAPYFARIEGSAAAPTYGFNKITVTADRLSSTFVNSSGTGFADSFTIDRGVPPPPVTRTYGAVADATVKKAAPTTAFGRAATVATDGSPVEHALAKYTVTGTSGYTVTSARIRMYVVRGGSSGARFYRTGATNWADDHVTWNSAPSTDPTPVASLGATTTGAWVEVDVSPVIRGDGTYSFRGSNTSTEGTEFASREASTDKPQLVLTLQPSTPPVGGTLTLTPTADVTLKRDTPGTNYGGTTDLKADASPVEEVLLRFTVAGTQGRPVQSARLRLHVTNPSPAGGAFHPVTDTGWAESTVTWTTAPVAGATAVATLGAVTLNQWVEVDLTGYVRGDGVYALRVKGGSTDGAAYSAREAGSLGPQLVVSY